MSGYAAGQNEILPRLLETIRLQREVLDNILIELQAQSAMSAQAFDLYEGPEGYRQISVTASPSSSPSP